MKIEFVKGTRSQFDEKIFIRQGQHELGDLVPSLHGGYNLKCDGVHTSGQNLPLADHIEAVRQTFEF